MGLQVKEEIVGEDRGTSGKKIPNGSVTIQFGALFTRPKAACEYHSTDSMNSILPVTVSQGDRLGCRHAEVPLDGGYLERAEQVRPH